MRKSQKKEILEMTATLYEAHEEVKNSIQSGNYMQVQGLLAQCQECAIGIGNVIEKSEGEGFVTVHYIEEYCDALFGAYDELGGTDEVNGNKIYKSLRKQLLKIENSVRNDVPIRKEIVFFPYKASMWDSLESVYLAAKEDPECDAYCVPIPYYDVNSDGSLGQMHYEGKDYPKNIEITDWEKYDLEKRRPDVAYIHNPYDEHNLVTRVHERFFSSNIKKYVDELIYIPYFVLREIEPDDQNAIDGMKHFIWLPGVVHADKVIVQSEKMAQIYRNEFRKAAIANGLPEKYTSKAALEKKILGLGSPKIEKVKNTKKEDLEIPQEWQKIINKPDGSHKKIVFYNTSVGALLANNEKMLEKMKDVFRIFKENKEEIALLWRPHPLIENTVKAMRPQLWNEYKKIVEQYKTEGWGIYDDTVDMDRAVVLSDAYYGDGSSVVQLYQQTGKPVMMQSVYLPYDTNSEFVDKDALCFENLYDDGTFFWFTAYDFNALFRMSKETWLAEYVGSFPNEDMLGARLYSEILEYDGKLYFTPFRAKEVAVYDKEKGVISKISFDELNIGFLDGCFTWNYYSAHLFERNIYFLPHERTAILKYDICQNKFTAMYDEIGSIVGQYVMSANRLVFRSVLKNGCIYAPISGSNLVEVINLKENSSKAYEIGEKGNEYIDICEFGENFVLLPLQGNEIIIWNPSDGIVSKIALESEKSAKYQFRCAIANDFQVFLFPFQYKEILEIEQTEEKLNVSASKLNELVQIEAINKLESRYEGALKTKDNKFMVFDMCERKLIEFDAEMKEIKKESVFICNDDKADIELVLSGALNDALRGKKTFNEKVVFDIGKLIEYIKLLGEY